jgi:hypothetical protein
MTQIPAAYEHAVLIYEAMAKEAKVQEVDKQEVPVYTGFLTKLFAKERLSVPYYTSVMRDLSGMDCVRQLRRGGGSSMSSWALVQSPTPELFAMARERPSAAVDFNPGAKVDAKQNQQGLRDLNARLLRVEDWIQRQEAQGG